MAIAKRQSHKMLTYDRGRRAEFFAALYLRLKGYKILSQRYKTKGGEIDIVARRGSVIAFVEVKARTSQQDALESLTYNMRRRIERAAGFFMADHHKLSTCDMRFDLITVSSRMFSKPFFIQHLDNAWGFDS